MLWGEDMRLASSVAVVALLAWVSVLGASQNAFAVGCGAEKQIFVRTPLSASWQGTAGWVHVYNSSLDSCSGAWSVRTQHVTSSSSNVDQAEAGWREDLAGGTKEWFSFTESQVGAMFCGEYQYYSATTNNVGGVINYKVNNVSGTTSWDFFADFGSGYVNLYVNSFGDTRCVNVFQDGRAEGEVSVAQTSSAHSDDYGELRKGCGGSCSWNPWNSTHSDGGNIPNWYPDCYSSNAFRVVQSNNHNCG